MLRLGSLMVTLDMFVVGEVLFSIKGREAPSERQPEATVLGMVGLGEIGMLSLTMLVEAVVVVELLVKRTGETSFG